MCIFLKLDEYKLPTRSNFWINLFFFLHKYTNLRNYIKYSSFHYKFLITTISLINQLCTDKKIKVTYTCAKQFAPLIAYLQNVWLKKEFLGFAVLLIKVFGGLQIIEPQNPIFIQAWQWNHRINDTNSRNTSDF